MKDAIVDRLRDKLGARPDVDTQHPAVSVVAHLAKDRLSLSLDLCGEPLHRRGYRVRPTIAPLKETLAAAILRAAKYTGEEPLLDPMCGSGTLLIEAGMIARRRAPSLHRSFAVERWPHLGAKARELLEELPAAGARERAEGAASRSTGWTATPRRSRRASGTSPRPGSARRSSSRRATRPPRSRSRRTSRPGSSSPTRPTATGSRPRARRG